MPLVGKESILLPCKDNDGSLMIDKYDSEEFHVDIFYGEKLKATMNLDLENAIKLRDYLIENVNKEVVF